MPPLVVSDLFRFYLYGIICGVTELQDLYTTFKQFYFENDFCNAVFFSLNLHNKGYSINL